MIRLSTFEDNSFEPFQTLTEETYNLLKQDCEVLTKSYIQFVVFKYLQLNLKDYADFVLEWTNVPAYKMDLMISTNIHFVLEFNKRISNVLMSFKFFLDNAQTYLKRKYGKESIIAKDFTELTHNLFDNSFAYRFLSKLRNYSAHLGFPLEIVLFKIDFNNEFPESSKHSSQLLLNIESLKKEKDLFGSIIYRNLNEMTEDLDLIPLINELSFHIISIQKFIYFSERNELDEAIENIEMFVGSRKTKSNQIKAYTYENTNGNSTMQIFDIPFEILEEFKNTYRSWC
nr:hypothetical protein [uncultured Flavobacterium sp.]